MGLQPSGMGGTTDPYALSLRVLPRQTWCSALNGISRGEPQKLGSAWVPPLWNGGVDCCLKTSIFPCELPGQSSESKRIRRNRREPQKLGNDGTQPPCGGCVAAV